MFDFIRKPLLWQAWDNGLHKEIGATGSFHLKTIQDLAVYSYLRECRDLKIAEIGGADSRLLPALAKHNTCFNVEKFEGANGGVDREIHIPGVENVKAFLGEYDPKLKPESFDVAFSVSVVEHAADLDRFFDDGMRILKSGGLWIHAVDIYVEDAPSERFIERFETLRNWVRHPSVTPLGPIYAGPLAFSCDMASNTDLTMYNWSKMHPTKSALRQMAQSASILVGARKN